MALQPISLPRRRLLSPFLPALVASLTGLCCFALRVPEPTYQWVVSKSQPHVGVTHTEIRILDQQTKVPSHGRYMEDVTYVPNGKQQPYPVVESRASHYFESFTAPAFAILAIVLSGLMALRAAMHKTKRLEPLMEYGACAQGMVSVGESFAMASNAGVASAAKANYEKLAGIRVPVKGFFLSGGDSRFLVQYTQHDYATAGPDGRLPRKRSFATQTGSFPIELGPTVLLMVPESNGERLAVFKAPPADMKDAPSAGWLEIWTEASLEKTISLGSACGPALADPWFSGADWSPDGTRLVFVAEPKRPSRSHWGPSKEEDAVHPLGMSLKYRQRQDWGEQYTAKVTSPKLWTVNVADGQVNCLTDPEDFGFSCGQPIWRSDTQVLFVGWRVEERLGLIYCHQRASGLYSVELPTSSEPAAKQPPQLLTTTPIDFSCRSPRLHPDGNSLVYLSRESVGPHFTASRLRCLDLNTLNARTVVDVVDDPKGGFPGLYTSTLPRRCWIGPTELVTSTQWGLDEALVRIGIADGKVERLVSPHHPLLHSITVYDASVTTGSVLASVSSPLTPPDVYIIRPDGEWLRAHSPHPANVAASEVVKNINVERLEVKTDDGVGAAQFDSLAYWPSTTSDSPPSPFVILPHGGPHAAATTHWTVSVLLMTLSGYAVTLPNYRGSTGYGEQALNSLPGKIGDQDVRDCMLTVDLAIGTGKVDKDRLVVIGGSHGGFLSCHLTSLPHLAHRFKATAMRNPVTNLALLLGTSDIEDWVVFEAGLGTPEEQLKCCGGIGLNALANGITLEHLQTLHAKSPSSNVKKVTAATLMLLGKDDRRVPPSQGQYWVRALRVKGDVPVECYEYDDNRHALDEAFADGDVWVNTITWLDKYV